MSKQEEREKNIFSKVNFEKLPFKVDKNNWKTFGTNISIFLHQVFKLRVTKEPLNWCFANIKRVKINQ